MNYDTEYDQMGDTVREQIDTYLPHLDGLIARGRQLRDTLAADPSSESAIAATRAWQEHCGVTVNQLSGGSKAHWLARSFSEAFLMRSTGARVVEGAAPAEIVDRLVGVLEQAVGSLSQMREGQGGSASSEAAPAPRRFNFVHNSDLRPVLEQAYSDSRSALEEGNFDVALLTSCGILEAIVTDALEHKGPFELAVAGTRPLADWSFEERLAVAERVGLIRGGCARLPAIARQYRELDPAATVSERDAQVTGQVLKIVMRDLDPGR